MSNLNGTSANHSDRSRHTEIEDLLTAYIAGELDKEVEQAMVERHIANCAICQQTIVETSRIFTLLSTLTHSDTPLNNSVFKQPSSLADAVLSQLVQGKSIDDNETIEVIARPFLTLPGVIRTEINNESFDDHAGTHSRIPWIRKHESRRQQESGRNMNIIFVPKFGRDKSGPYAWFATIVATVLILFIIGGGLMLLVRIAQHTTTGLSPSGAMGSSSAVSITATPPPNVRQLAHVLVKQFHQEVAIWGAAHLYHDSFDGHDYQLNTAYMQAGLGGIVDTTLTQAQTDADFRGVVDEANNALFNLHMLEIDAGDTTPFNQTHQSDLQALHHYHLQGQVIIVSLAGQAMRVYQDGKLVKAFLVTTGPPKLPALPIVTKEMFRLVNVTFKASVPRADPDWFPNTPIKYAIQYHTGGYYFYNAWWQTNFGPTTQFPHETSSKINGGVGLNENDAAWFYNNTNLNTSIVIY